MPGPKKGLGS